jgi:predicted transcriptional regulator
MTEEQEKAKHPIQKIIDAEGMSRTEFAKQLDIDYEVLTRCLLGYKRFINPGILRALVKAGYDITGIEDQYRKWRFYSINQVDR